MLSAGVFARLLDTHWTRGVRVARRIKDATLDSRAARARLKVQGKPHWRAVERGLHLGYRRLRGKPGTWCARFYLGGQRYGIEPIGNADDLSDADGVAILSFDQATSAARGRMVTRAHAAAGVTGVYRVRDAMRDYIQHLEDDGRSSASVLDVKSRATALIIPKLGDRPIAELKALELTAWRNQLAKSGARLRTKAGQRQQHRELDTEESRRARRVSTNRVLVMLRAALNRAFRDGRVGSDREWRKVEAFKGVDVPRARYLSVSEAQRLINACAPDLRALVTGALQTGMRYGELSRLRVSDFNADASTIHVRRAKSGRARHVVLTSEGAAFFERHVASRASDELMFVHSDGRPWLKAHQSLPLRDACRRAAIKNFSFHATRHTWASLAAMAGVPLLVIARQLGHRDARMVELHYGHLAPDFISDAIRAGAPRFGLKASSNVVTLR